jgi:hypothetical protein
MYRRGVYKLGDMGIACKVSESTRVDSEGDGRYLAKELLADDYSNLPKADVFSLGARYTLRCKPFVPTHRGLDDVVHVTCESV